MLDGEHEPAGQDGSADEADEAEGSEADHHFGLGALGDAASSDAILAQGTVGRGATAGADMFMVMAGMAGMAGMGGLAGFGPGMEGKDQKPPMPGPVPRTTNPGQEQRRTHLRISEDTTGAMSRLRSVAGSF